MKTLSLIAGMAMVIGTVAVNADEPMKLSAAEMDGVTAGCGLCGGNTFTFTKYVDTTNVAYVYLDKDVYSTVFVYGNLADAEATAQAFGPGSLAETVTFTSTNDLSSVAYSGSVSATN